MLAPLKQLDARAACEVADEFLVNEVGDLLMVDNPRLAEDGRWVMSIMLGNAIQGLLGEVGTISVDAESGAIRFSEEDRTRLKARARELSRAAAP